MPKSVGALEVHQGADAVVHVEAAGQLAEQVPQPSAGVGPVGVAVLAGGQEQVLRRAGGRGLLGQVPAGPFLLGTNDRHDLLVDQDGVGGSFDLGLLVVCLLYTSDAADEEDSVD